MEGEKMFYPEKKEKAKNLLLEGPELVSPEEEKKQEGEMSFSFSSDTRRYYLGHKDGKPFFMVEYFDSLPDELSEEEKERFTKEKRKYGETEKVVYVLRYGEVPELREEMREPNPSQSKKYRVAQSRDFERDIIDSFIADDANKQVMSEILAKHSELSPKEISQIVEQTFEAYRRQDHETIRTISSRFPKKVAEMVKNEIRERMLPKPQEMEIAQLVEVLKNKKVLFYTGAGISIASGVHSMDQLQESLGIEMSQKVDGLLKNAIANPQDVIDSWEEFTKAAFEKPATPAHQSLGTLAQKLKSQIFTENVDHLQERAGVKPIHLTGPWLKENVQPEWLKDIDVVITVGLSYDDRGFLGWYKENNPNGKIIAINLSQPSYLGNEDFILKGDCQKIVPELEKEFAAKA
ncbi:MAG: Sir2 family NAD-dependent protein deacetylase [Minisyncoccia bacterium]